MLQVHWTNQNHQSDFVYNLEILESFVFLNTVIEYIYTRKMTFDLNFDQALNSMDIGYT